MTNSLTITKTEYTTRDGARTFMLEDKGGNSWYAREMDREDVYVDFGYLYGTNFKKACSDLEKTIREMRHSRR